MAETTATVKERTSTGTLTEVYLAMVWLVTTLYTAHLSITGNTEDLSGLLGDGQSSSILYLRYKADLERALNEALEQV